MASTSIRKLVFLGGAVLVALAIGAFFLMQQQDEGAHASGVQLSDRVPEGFVFDRNFECTSFGITRILSLQSIGDYNCVSDAGAGIGCLIAQTGRAMLCSDGTIDSTCTVVDGTDDQAECTETGGGAHVCAPGAYGITCENTSAVSGGQDFIECYQAEGLGVLECGTNDGSMVCIPGETELTCATLYRSQQGLWGDADCSGTITARDNQAILKRVLDQPALAQTEPCPNVGQKVNDSPAGF